MELPRLPDGGGKRPGRGKRVGFGHARIRDQEDLVGPERNRLPEHLLRRRGAHGESQAFPGQFFPQTHTFLQRIGIKRIKDAGHPGLDHRPRDGIHPDARAIRNLFETHHHTHETAPRLPTREGILSPGPRVSRRFHDIDNPGHLRQPSSLAIMFI